MKETKMKLKWMVALVLTASSVFGANGGLEISRAEYHEKLQGFWLGECIANWTGLRTEGVKKPLPFSPTRLGGPIRAERNRRSSLYWWKKETFGAPMTIPTSNTITEPTPRPVRPSGSANRARSFREASGIPPACHPRAGWTVPASSKR